MCAVDTAWSFLPLLPQPQFHQPEGAPYSMQPAGGAVELMPPSLSCLLTGVLLHDRPRTPLPSAPPHGRPCRRRCCYATRSSRCSTRCSTTLTWTDTLWPGLCSLSETAVHCRQGSCSRIFLFFFCKFIHPPSTHLASSWPWGEGQEPVLEG